MADEVVGEEVPVTMRAVEEILVANGLCNLGPLLFHGFWLGSSNLPNPLGYARGHVGTNSS